MLKRYVDGRVHTNGIENFWAMLKRGLNGTYVSVEPFHLFRYVDERVFTFNERDLTDLGRFSAVLGAVSGRRLTYAAPHSVKLKGSAPSAGTDEAAPEDSRDRWRTTGGLMEHDCPELPESRVSFPGPFKHHDVVVNGWRVPFLASAHRAAKIA